ncbi:hypothetical protein ACIBQ6_13405 [Nonomuraea sp. NPDC049655]|uniref:hypothetical protein n=1 Tax=Nonomuraea sp. NPDC049655 TaxID=3364355 RepID=UPI0037A798BD
MALFSNSDLIRSIDAHIFTGDDDDTNGGGTDADVYLGIAGREFRLSFDNDHWLEPGDDDHFIFGIGGNTSDAKYNDPTDPQLSIGDVLDNIHNVYVRMNVRVSEYEDPWHVERVHVTVNGFQGPSVSFIALDGDSSQWLGYDYGLILYLKRTDHHINDGTN